MYSSFSEGKLVVVEMSIKTLKGKVYKKSTSINSKSYLSYLNKLVGQTKNTYHYSSIDKNTADADYSNRTENIESRYEAPKFKVSHSVRINKYKNIFSKGYTKTCSREILVDIVLKANSWTYQMKHLKGEVIGTFYEEELLLSNI